MGRGGPREFPAQALGSKKSVGGGDTCVEKGGKDVPDGGDCPPPQPPPGLVWELGRRVGPGWA